jgi:hypothetical protein
VGRGSYARLVPHRRYDVIPCTVTSHVRYGLIVTLDTGERGWIEDDRIRDDRSICRDQWPAVGTQLDAVVLGVLENGRVCLCSMPSYVEVIRHAFDPDAAARAWSLTR